MYMLTCLVARIEIGFGCHASAGDIFSLKVITAIYFLLFLIILIVKLIKSYIDWNKG